ncbi:AcrR family transcriptional regulator [Bradyrhizobium sp. i1.4.4]
MLLFWRKGFAAASMHDLCDAMGVRSPSLYAAFESKEALYLAAIEHYVETQGQPVWDRLAEGATARAGIENLLIGAAETLPKSRRAPAGCMAVLGAVSDEWPANDCPRDQEGPARYARQFARAAGGCGRERRTACRNRHRCAEPVLPQRLRRHGDPGQGRRDA